MSLMNRLGNCANPNQGHYKKVLCVCSAGLLRSPTAAIVLSQDPFNFNTRACGIVPQFALIPIEHVLLEWCDEIVCMEKFQLENLPLIMEKLGLTRPIVHLEIEDNYRYRDPELMKLVKDRYIEKTGFGN